MYIEVEKYNPRDQVSNITEESMVSSKIYLKKKKIRKLIGSSTVTERKKAQARLPPAVLTVTTSLKGPVPSLFCANTLNWYSVPGSSPGTTNQVWAPETGIECQSCGPKSVLFDLKTKKKQKTGIRTKTWNFYTDSIVKHRCNSFHIQFGIVFSSLRNLKENTLFLSANAWIVFQHGEDYWEDVDLHWTVPHGERLFEAAVVTGFPGHISRGCRRQYMDIAGSVWTGACVD